MNRFFQILLIFSTLAFCWLAMMAVHEAGHVLHAWLTGGTVERVVLHPLAISRTDVLPYPPSLVVVWGGPIWGCLIPLAVLAIVRFAAKSHVYLAAFFAGFCLIANGAYLMIGAFLPPGFDDGGVILRNGGARWQLIAFGLFTIPAGLYLWNGLGPHFGLGAAKGNVDRRAAVGTAGVLAVLVILELILSC